MTAAHPRLVVGFDLDMTLFDTSPAIAATLAATARDLDVTFDVERFLEELGPPLETMVAAQLPDGVAQAFVDRYREIYEKYVSDARLLPGARESIDAVVEHGGQSIVITGKNDRDANRHVRQERLDVAHVIGYAWANTKTDALRRHGAGVYVGDHPMDMVAADAAGALRVAVTTGTHGPEAFPEVDAVLGSLAEFPGWLAANLTAARRPS